MRAIGTFPIIVLSLLFAVAACGPGDSIAPTGEPQAEIANPASVFCVANGGTLEIRTGPGGGQIGVCLFPDGSECEEWAYFRAECQPAGMLSTPEVPASSSTTGVEPLALQVLSPEDAAVVDTALIQLNGTVSPGSAVTVNDEILIAGNDGAFETTVLLEEGVNLIEVVASNAYGDEEYVHLAVTYQP